ncbi:ATP-binding protein [Streptococcus rubneri]|uniref:ATP-binding protein n=1 Tax=Streptococcus rubneri TaxID=1234680 RepID=A0A4Z1DTM4_9STRE|nr:ATP-binding protein [Streptococcus rubneri]MBK4774656.1 ATP-binding protein [Streptococcus rubneri]TGN91933.1 ATP-binding protein [Streptococcus rubneri]
MGIKNLINKAGAKAADKVAKLSALSPEQLEAVEKQKEKYLADQPNVSDEELTNRLLASCGVEVFNSYLDQIKELYVPLESTAEYEDEFHPSYNIRYFNITKWVTDKKENSLEKLVNVYEVLSNEHCNIALVFHRTSSNTKVYLAVVNTENANDNVNVENYRKRLLEAIKGNFPGSTISEEVGRGRIPCLNLQKPFSVATVSNLPTTKSEKFISQTIEKLIDGIVPENPSQDYTLILLANPIQNIENHKLRLSELYSALAPFKKWQTNYTFTESDSTTSMATFGVNIGASAGIQQGQNQATNQNTGQSETTGDSTTDSTGESDGTNTSHTSGSNEGSSSTKTKGKNGNLNLKIFSYGENVGTSKTTLTGASVSDTVGRTITKTVGKALTKTASKAISETLGKTVGATKGINLGTNVGANFARASNVTASVGKNEGITQFFMNHNIQHALTVLDEQMKRFEKGTALGMWDFAAYVLSEDQNIANNVAHTYLALTQGEESYMSKSSVNLWRGDMGEKSGDTEEIVNYIRDLRHPIFGLNPNLLEKDATFYVYPSVITPTVPLSGQELAYSLNFPQKSIPGLPILECTEFGRNIVSYDLEEKEEEKIRLGNIFHMNREETVPVELSQNSLSSHVFITGSTGSGKSNTIYQLLAEAKENHIKFLVVEPAKGEYKHIFGQEEDVCVYGTNPQLTPLLKLNPFSFTKETHILEHLDRLIEIFNVCWPMYAAMPAVLKKAVEKSYIDCGWDLIKSVNEFGGIYPTFADVAENIKEIIDSSEYDNENKGAYKGSLLTRIESLTNGINGLIFSQEELSNQQLFDSNVIVDLSRVGSSETKSLIMGILVLKLQEYRMSQADMNSSLRHLTVLEEAHNLLKRTSTEQVSESSNLIGKSVEMLANSIAEMRTYGEGFIIADQAPGLLDLSVIRNTNTKIIMRLPDWSDRELVGKSANLNDDQILELARLPKGVAAVYQNEWIQPVLCKVDKFDDGDKVYQYRAELEIESSSSADLYLMISKFLTGNQTIEQIDLEKMEQDLFKAPISGKTIYQVLNLLRQQVYEVDMVKIAPIISNFYPSLLNKAREAEKKNSDKKSITSDIVNEFNKVVEGPVTQQVRLNIIQAILTQLYVNELKNNASLEEWRQQGGLL